MNLISVLTTAALSLAAVTSVPAAQAVQVERATAPTTQLTLRIADCEGCRVGVAHYLQGSTDFWSAGPKKVTNGVVTFAVPTEATEGLSITVRAPWEGATGYVTNVALRYKGKQPGDKVGFTAARASTRASGCWAGTTSDQAVIKVKVREVKVDGYGGKVPGSIAWAAVTQEWLRPLVTTWHGVVGTQDVMPCRAG